MITLKYTNMQQKSYYSKSTCVFHNEKESVLSFPHIRIQISNAIFKYSLSKQYHTVIIYNHHMAVPIVCIPDSYNMRE